MNNDFNAIYENDEEQSSTPEVVCLVSSSGSGLKYLEIKIMVSYLSFLKVKAVIFEISFKIKYLRIFKYKVSPYLQQTYISNLQ